MPRKVKILSFEKSPIKVQNRFDLLEVDIEDVSLEKQPVKLQSSLKEKKPKKLTSPKQQQQCEIATTSSAKQNAKQTQQQVETDADIWKKKCLKLQQQNDQLKNENFALRKENADLEKRIAIFEAAQCFDAPSAPSSDTSRGIT